jgi:azobenzene reductase
MQVMLISGSVAEKSHTRALVGQLAVELESLKVPTVIWDLRKETLPMADPAYHASPDEHPDPVVRRFVQEVRQSDGVALASPLYHGSFSGVLKNALDHLGYDAFRNKPVALLSHGGGERRCSLPNIALQPVISTLFGYTVQSQVSTSMGDYTKDAGGNPTLTSPGIFTRLKQQAEELVKLAKIFSKKPE